jgi:hypothetical protein
LKGCKLTPNDLSCITFYDKPFLKSAKEKMSQKKLFFDYDGHFTISGHDVVAESLYEFTKTKGLMEMNGALHW